VSKLTLAALRDYDQRLLKYASLLEKSIRASAGKSINFSERITRYSFDVMSDLSFGHSFDGLASEKTHWAITSIRESNAALGILGPVPWLIHLMTKLPDALNPMQKLITFSNEQVDKRKQLHPAEPDIMSHLLDQDEPFFKDPAQEYHLFTGDVRLLIIAGSDTTATALAFLFYQLALNPTLQKKLFQEISDLEINVQTVQDLPYLNAVINETLRLHPPVPSMPPRDTPAEGVKVGDISIPGDVTVYTPLYSLHRSDAFKKPLEFIPERWTTQPELIQNRKVFAPFLIGPYACIGRQLAYNEMRTVAARLVSGFEVALGKGEDGHRLLYSSADNFTTTIGNLDLVFTPRKSS
jgi:cytochrome P450 family 628